METKEFTEVIDYIAKNKLIETIIENCRKSDDEDFQDLAQDIYLYLLDKQPPQLIKAYNKGEVNNYLSRIVVNNIYSKTSPFYYKYKKHLNNQIPIENIEI